MYDRILVPLDGSGPAEMALPYAIEIAARAGSTLVLMSVCETPGSETERLYRTYLEQARTRVISRLQEGDTEKHASVRTEVHSGKPADELLGYSEQYNAGLIIMASRGRSGKSEWPLGNIAAKMLRATRVPVLLIRTPAAETAIRKKELIKKILLPLDGSRLGESALPAAEDLAELMGAELGLLHVMQSMYPLTIMEGTMLQKPVREDDETTRADAKAYLAAAAGRLRNKTLTLSTDVVSGQPADWIVKYAEFNQVDLIAMATHGRSGIGRWAFGSVTDKVLHAGNMPVLVVRPK